MGNFFRRRRQPVEELDEIVKRLHELETQLKGHIDGRADLLRTLVFAAAGLWGASSAYAWLHFLSLSHLLGALAVSLLISILVFIGLRLLCLSGYDYIIERKRRKIEYYTERRVTIIEDVKENEKFKVAREIIEKYGSESDLNRLYCGNASNVSQMNTPALVKAKAGDTTAGRVIVDASGRNTVAADVTATVAGAMANGSSTPTGRPPLPKLHEMTSTRRFARTPVRPFVEPSGNPLDRILDYVMGESINNRYALICASCRVHNGMALREEFDQVAYFCFKCGAYNPSRNEMRATAEGIQRRNSGPRGSSPFRRQFYSTNTRTFNGPSRTPSIRSLAAITGREEDDYSAMSTTTNGSENDDGNSGSAPTETARSTPSDTATTQSAGSTITTANFTH